MERLPGRSHLRYSISQKVEWFPRFWWYSNFPYNKPSGMHAWGRFLKIGNDNDGDFYAIAISTNGVWWGTSTSGATNVSFTWTKLANA